MKLRLYHAGVDWEFALDLAEQEYHRSDTVVLAGYLLAIDRHGRRLISFDDMIEGADGSRREYPCWLPAQYVMAELEESQPQIAGYGRGSFAIPRWLAAHLDQITAARLRLARADLAAEREDQKRAARARQARLQHENAAAMARPRKSGGGQGSLF